MNRFIVVTGVLITMALLGCQEAKEDVARPLSEKDFYKTIGEEIPFETGMAWIELYRKKRTEQGRSEATPPYAVSADQLKAVLTSAEELVGVAFHYGIDENGQTHILVIPVDETLTLWPSSPGRIVVDANTGSALTREVASAWASNYKNAYPDETWFHFFGKEVFDQMCALPYFSSMELEPAISALDLTPQLLLIVLNDDSSSLGRSAEEVGVVYDASNACPPCAVR